MLTTRFVDGAPCWIDVAAPDPEGAASFYRALFGWSYRSAGPEGGGYGFLERAGRIVGGCAPLTGDRGPAAWTVYFRTSDADATAEAVRRARGACGPAGHRRGAGQVGGPRRPDGRLLRRVAAGQARGP